MLGSSHVSGPWRGLNSVQTAMVHSLGWCLATMTLECGRHRGLRQDVWGWVESCCTPFDSLCIYRYIFRHIMCSSIYNIMLYIYIYTIYIYMFTSHADIAWYYSNIDTHTIFFLWHVRNKSPRSRETFQIHCWYGMGDTSQQLYASLSLSIYLYAYIRRSEKLIAETLWSRCHD